MGTPDIAATSLQAIIQANHEICGVFTREDKPVGRKQILTAPAVKQLAVANNIPVFQPKTLKDGESERILKELNPELIVVVAYGMILPKSILAIPKYGCINLHVSLLPKYRGAAPIQHAVLNGDKETGVTIMYMDEGLDTGDIIMVEKVIIDEDETAGDVFENVASTGAITLVKAISEIEKGGVNAVPQDSSKASNAPPLSKDMSLFSFDNDNVAVHNLARGLSPWPVAYFITEDKKVKVLRCKKSMLSGKTGEVLSTKPLIIACKTGAIELCEVQAEGKRPMQGFEWAAGRRLKNEDIIQ